MNCLFKLSIVHLKKNIPLVCVLSFFSASGITVLSSSDHLIDNLHKGFEEINFDSNPHDLVLVNKFFKPSQDINLKQRFLDSVTNIDFTFKNGYKWSMISNKDHSFMKKGKYDEIKKKGDQDDLVLQKIVRYPKTILTIPNIKPIKDGKLTNKTFLNHKLLCMSDVSISAYVKEVAFSDINRSSLVPSQKFSNQNISDEDDLYSRSLTVKCPGEPGSDRRVNEYMEYLFGIYWFFQENIAGKQLNDWGADYTFTPQNKDKQDEETLDEQEKHEIMMEQFNPQRILKYEIDPSKQVWAHRPIIEEDYYFSFRVPLVNVNENSKVSLVDKFRQMALGMKSSLLFHKLEDSIKNDIEAFLKTKTFEDIEAKYYFSSFNNELDVLDFWIPTVYGMSFKETLIFLTKLILWQILDDNQQPFNVQKLTDFNDEIKGKLKSIISSWNSTDGIKTWNPFKSLDVETDGTAKPRTAHKFHNKSEDYLFSVLRASSKLSELKKDSQKYSQEYKGKNTSGGKDSHANWCTSGTSGTSGTSCSALNESESDTLVDKWKKVLNDWIDEKYFTDNRSSSSDGGLHVIPAQNKNSFSKKASKTEENTYFAPTGDKYEVFRPFPDPFKDVYNTIIGRIKTALSNYVSFLSTKSTKELRKFIYDHNIFNLSFILNNFKYVPKNHSGGPLGNISLNSAQNRTQRGGGWTPPSDFDEFAPSINYHKSIVVNNTSVNAKLNDKEQKTIGHSFKVITQESMDGSTVNRAKLLSGNPLFEVRRHYAKMIKRLNLKDPRREWNSTREYLDIFKMLANAKYTDPSYSKLFKKIYEYLSYPYSDPWTQPHLFFSREESDQSIDYLEQFKRYAENVKEQGSKVFFNFINFSYVFLSRYFRLVVSKRSFPTSGYIDHFSSAFGLISPFYAEKNNIKPISNEQYEKFKKMVEGDDVTQEEWEREYNAFLLNPNNHDHIVNINGNKVIIVGTALTPDMSLPTHSWFNLVPNKETEALVFMDEYGYKNIQSNSLSSWNEFYLSISYPQAVKDLHLEDDYFNALHKHIDEFLSDNAHATGMSSDFDLRKINDIKFNSLVSLRSNYVSKFTGSVLLLSNILLGFMGMVILFTAWTLIKKYISNNINTFGVFVANGTTRLLIMLNSFAFIMIPCLVGIVIGYFIGLAAQPFIFSLFSDIWYLTPVFNGFNISNLLYYILISSGILGVISFLSSAKTLSPDVGQLMKINMAFKQSKLVKTVCDFLHNVSPLWRFRFSIILNTISKGLILSISTTFLFVFIVFTFNNFGQLEKVGQLEKQGKDYGFDISFITPTEQSGQYFLSSYKNLGDTFLNKIPSTKKVLTKTSEGNWKVEEVQINAENPELISSGIHSPFYAKDFADYIKQCNSSDSISNLNKKYRYINYDYPSRFFAVNSYNMYLSKSKLSRKNNANGGAQQELACTGLENQYDFKPFNLPTPTHETLKLFYPSSKEALQLTTDPLFNPSMEDANVRANLNLGDYVPVKNELWKKSSTGQNGQNGQTEKEMLKFGDEPLFKPLIEYYKKKDTLFKETTKTHSSAQNLKSWGFINNVSDTDSDGVIGDYRKLSQGSDSQYHPTLSRLFKDHSNYWLFTYTDMESIKKDPIYFKNKVILPFLFNHNWKFDLLGKSIEINPWQEFSDFFNKYSPELISSIDSNYAKFVEAIINSRYGEYFVNRFMTKIPTTNGTEAPIVNYYPGKEYQNKKVWEVDPAKMKQNNSSSGSSSSNIEKGYYWFDPSKILYLYNKLIEASKGSQSKEETVDIGTTIVFRPDFLYLFFALMCDEEFLKTAAPIKISFNQNLYVPDYSNYLEEWTIEGDVAKDRAKKKGLVSEDDTGIYDQIPNGDQTYTYLKGNIKSQGINNVKFIGLKKDGRGSYVKLKSGSETINERLYGPKVGGAYPVIINHYTAKKLGVSQGSTFKFHASNIMDRFSRRMRDEVDVKEVTMRVVGIFDSYYQNSFFISQKHANEIIGLNPDYGYNAIFTKKFSERGKTLTLPYQFSKAVSAYSSSGIYTNQMISKSGLFLDFLKSQNNVDVPMGLWGHKFIQPDNHRRIALLNGLDLSQYSSDTDVAGRMSEIFGTGFSMSPMVSDVINQDLANDFIFNTANNLVISIMNLFISVLSPLLICSLLIITNLIIDDLKNLLTILNLLGFTYLENSVTILLYLSLVLGISTALSIPISSMLISFYVESLFNNISLFLPMYLRSDYALYCFIIILGMFGFSYLRSMKKIKSLYLPTAMKNLNY